MEKQNPYQHNRRVPVTFFQILVMINEILELSLYVPKSQKSLATTLLIHSPLYSLYSDGSQIQKVFTNG